MEHHALVSARAVWANVLVERMCEFGRYIRSKPWIDMLAGDGLETEGLRGICVGKCALLETGWRRRVSAGSV